MAVPEREFAPEREILRPKPQQDAVVLPFKSPTKDNQPEEIVSTEKEIVSTEFEDSQIVIDARKSLHGPIFGFE